MTTKTDYLSLNGLNKVYHPKNEGFVSGAEGDLIRKELELKERTNIELNNIRDMAVMFFGILGDAAQAKAQSKDLVAGGVLGDYFELRDKLSAIVCIIDNEKMNRGMPV